MNPMLNQPLSGVALPALFASGGDPLDPASAGRNWTGPGSAHVGTTGATGAAGTGATDTSSEPAAASQTAHAATETPLAVSAAYMLSDVDRVGLEAQALQGFLRHATASSVRRLFHYLESHSAAFPQLSAQLPLLTRAVDAYRVGDFPQAFTLAFQVHRAIVLTQALYREMPTLETL